MRSVFLLGGFVGFIVTFLSEWQAGVAGDRILMDSAIGCLVGALLFRWFWKALVKALTETVKTQRAARAAAEEAAAAAKAAAAPVPVKGR